MTKPKMTPREDEALTVFKGIQRLTGYAPTVREVGNELKVTSRAAYKLLDGLTKKARLVRRDNRRGFALP